jgi:hypothetical protein
MSEYTLTVTGPIDYHYKAGTLRIKSTTLLWKPRGERMYRRVTVAEFSSWMASKARVSK